MGPCCFQQRQQQQLGDNIAGGGLVRDDEQAGLLDWVDDAIAGLDSASALEGIMTPDA